MKSKPAFQDWLYKSNLSDKLPRGKYFKDKRAGIIPAIPLGFCYFGIEQHEFMIKVRAFTPLITITQNRADFFKGNITHVIDRPPTDPDMMKKFLKCSLSR